ncbi:hypothetical protein EKO27_g72 [Xylaria grammica]|uniref:Uncharacterized protein n=1 Tax=Xylaria grammica TaxID=363999 RepID=A0A439DKT9_9PEZI|nr:hypothetical protein EKO27_g72 [Xylaria grammica]
MRQDCSSFTPPPPSCAIVVAAPQSHVLTGTVMGLGMKTLVLAGSEVRVDVGVQRPVLPGVGVNETLLHEKPKLDCDQIMDDPALTWPDDRSPDDHDDGDGDGDVAVYGPVTLESWNCDELLVVVEDVVFVELRVLDDVVVGRELELFVELVVELVVERVDEWLVEVVE